MAATLLSIIGDIKQIVNDSCQPCSYYRYSTA